MGQLQSRRCPTLSICWMLSITFMLAPLAGNTYCSDVSVPISARSYILYGEEGGPPIGSHFGSAMQLAIVSGVFFDPSGRFDNALRTHRAVRRYAVLVAVDCCLWLIKPWRFHFCFSDSTNLGFVQLHSLARITSLMLLLFCAIGRLSLISGGCVDVTTEQCLALLTYILGIVAVALKFFVSKFHILSAVICAGALLYFGTHISIIVKTIRVANEAVAHAGNNLSGANWVRYTAVATAVSTTTSCASMVVWSFPVASLSGELIGEVLHFCDRCSDMTLAIVCVGLIGPRRNRDTEFVELGKLVQERRKQQIVEAMREAARAISGPSLVLAALFEGADPEQLLLTAVERFRCVSWDVLKQYPEIIIAGGTLDVVGPGSAELYDLSIPCRFSMCDAFLSHSWRDDATVKWNTISRWCEGFRQEHSRAPMLWLDKVCIQQSNIREDLQCLPIFLAACNNLVVLGGLSYTRRLWCCVELFVYVRMLAEDDTRHSPVILPFFSNDEDLRDIKKAWGSFDVSLCECSVEEDRGRIMDIIERNAGGLSALNAFIRDLGKDIQDCPETEDNSEGTMLQPEEEAEDDESVFSI